MESSRLGHESVAPSARGVSVGSDFDRRREGERQLALVQPDKANERRVVRHLDGRTDPTTQSSNSSSMRATNASFSSRLMVLPHVRHYVGIGVEFGKGC